MLREIPETQLRVTPVVANANASVVGGNGSLRLRLRLHAVGVFGDGARVNAKEVLPPDAPRAH